MITANGCDACTDGECTENGDYKMVPVATGCIADKSTNTSKAIECADGTITTSEYGSVDCSGDATSTTTVTAGCQEDGSKWDFTCDATTTTTPAPTEDAAPAKFIFMSVITLLTTYLFE